MPTATAFTMLSKRRDDKSEYSCENYLNGLHGFLRTPSEQGAISNSSFSSVGRS
jgi:hypothetical protein